MAEYKISITGDLGSGKSTVCKIISEKISAEVISIGSIQRAMAKEMGMTTYEFNRYMETHPEIDDKFDTMLKSYDAVFGKNMLFDSRLAWNFVPSAFSVYLTVDLKEAGRRVFNANRENEGYSSAEEAEQKLKARRASEVLRYSAAYGVTLSDMFNYDIIVDSTTATPEEFAGAILSECERYARGEVHCGAYISPVRLNLTEHTKGDGEVTVYEVDGNYFVLTGGDAVLAAKNSGKTLVCCKLVRK